MRKTGRTPMKYVYRFSEGNTSMADLLGGKGANLADMAQLGCPCRQASPSPPRPAATTTAMTASRPTTSGTRSATLSASWSRRLAALGDGQREDV